MIKQVFNQEVLLNRGKYVLFRIFSIITLTFIFPFSGCQSSQQVQLSELEQQKKEWVAAMKEAFPMKTTDTTELKRRLAYYQETGNKIGLQMMHRVLGNEYRNNSKFRSAIEHHTAGLQIAYEVHDTASITFLLNELGTDFRRVGSFSEASPYHYLSLEIAEAYKGKDVLQIERNMASAYNGIGSICRTMDEYDEALRVYGKALELELKHKNYRGIAINYANIGAIHFERSEFDKAEENYLISLQNNEKADYPMGIALCRINIGRIYEMKDKLDEALSEYMKAYYIMEGTSDKWHWLDACFKTGNIYTKKGDFNKARDYLERGLKTAQEIQSLKHIHKGYELLSELNYAQGNYRQAAREMLLTQLYADTLKRNQEVDRLLESRVKYETSRFVRQIEELDELNREQTVKRKNTLLLMIPVIIALLSLLLVILYKRMLERRQAVELKNLERMRSNFFTNITHEFRTPITVINGLSDHIRSTMKDTDSSQAKGLEAIQRQGRQLMHLVNQLLDFSRSEAGINKPKWRQGDIVGYLHVIIEPYTQYACSKGIDLFLYSEEENFSMNFVPSSVKKVLGNLLANAIKHCAEGDQIIMHFRYDKPTRKCCIQVKDSGDGIALENLPHIFELYYTSASDNAGSMGSGIGLALSKQLVEEMGGTISVSSVLGKGSEFAITLPVSLAEIPEEELECLDEDEMIALPVELPEEDEEEIELKKRNGKKTILIVEDNKDVVHYMKTILSGKYSLLHASDGNEGLLMAEQQIPDLIITDVMMPGKDGYAFTAELRASVAVAHIPVIMVTAKGTTEDKLEGLKAGADAYLPKPFDEQELLVRIKQLLNSRAMLMETYSNALFQGGRNNGAETDHNMIFITKLSNMVNDHLDDTDYFPDKLAQDMCLSESQLGRKLKAMTGHTITSFVMRARLNKAKQLLSRHDRSIKEVALACGFSDLSYFSRSFRKVFGYTPSQFIKIPEQQAPEQ